MSLSLGEQMMLPKLFSLWDCDLPTFVDSFMFLTAPLRYNSASRRFMED
jgi:hypothetical protein